MKTRELLRGHGVRFEVIEHLTTFTAQRMAQAVHVSGEDVAKTVLLCADTKYVVAVLPATHSIDLDKLPGILGAKEVTLANETECSELFPDSEFGVVPPFASQYGLETVIDEPLTKHKEIVFEGDAHDEAIRLLYEDYEKIEQPRVANFSHHI